MPLGYIPAQSAVSTAAPSTPRRGWRNVFIDSSVFYMPPGSGKTTTLLQRLATAGRFTYFIDSGSMLAQWEATLKWLFAPDDSQNSNLSRAVADIRAAANASPAFGPRFTLDEVLHLIADAQSEPDAHSHSELLQLVHKELSEARRIVNAVRKIVRLLRRIVRRRQRDFRGLSWSKRPWCLLHGSHPPKMSAPADVLGCA